MKHYFLIGWECIPVNLWMQGENKGVSYGDYGWRDSVTLDEALERSERMGSRCNGLAIKTGPSGLLVLDVDISHGRNGFASLKKFGIEIPYRSVEQRTRSGGAQFFFKRPLDLQDHTTRAGLFSKESGLDIRGVGGLSFVPPSQVRGSGSYRWIVSPFKQNPGSIPETLVEALKAQKRQTKARISGGKKSIHQLNANQMKYVHRYYEECRMAKVGTRSEKDLRLIVWLVKCQVRTDEIWQYVQNISKFQTDGYQYFRRTYERALCSN